MSATAELNSKILDFAQAAGEFGAAAKKIAEEDLAAVKEARPLVDKIADELVRVSLIEQGERDEAVKLASTHAGVLKLASNLISHIGKTKCANAQKEAQAMGRGVPDNDGQTKKASVSSTESPYVGRRAGLGEKRASDEALFRGLGINTADLAQRS